MTEDLHFKKLANMYLSAPINKVHYPTTKVEIEEGESTISIELDNNYHHAMFATHGSVYFKLLDDSAFFAANSLDREYFVLTSAFYLNFLRPVVSGKITGRGVVTSKSKSVIVADSVLFNEQGKEIGRATGNFMRGSNKLTDAEAYTL